MGSASDKDIYELTELEIPDVSYVAAGANRKTWTVIKSAEELEKAELEKSGGCEKVRSNCMSMKEQAGESGKQAEKDCAKTVAACERMSKSADSVDKASGDEEDDEDEEDPTDAITGAWRLIAPYKDELAVGLIAAFAAALKATGKDFSYGYPAPEAELSDESEDDEEASKSVKSESANKSVQATGLPLADPGTPWDAGKAKAALNDWAGDDMGKYARAFLYYDGSGKKGGCKLPIAMPINGTLKAIPNAIRAAKGRFNQTQAIPAAERARIQSILNGYSKKLGWDANTTKTEKSSSPLTLEGGDMLMDEYIARQLDEDSPREPEDEAFTDRVLKAAAEKDVSPEALKALKGALRLLMPVKDELDSDLIEELQEAIPQGAGVPSKSASAKKTKKQTEDGAPTDEADEEDEEEPMNGKKKSSKKSTKADESCEPGDQEKQKSRSTKKSEDGDDGDNEMKDTQKSAFDGLPEEIYKQFEDVRKTAAEAVAKAEKLEHEKRESEYIAKAREMPNVGDPVQMGQRLMHLAELDPKLAEEMEATLKSANERIEQGDLFAVVGSPMSGNVGGPGEQLEGLANALVQKGDKKLTQEQALEEVMKTAEGAKLAAQLYEQEESARGMRSGNPKIASGWKA